MAVSINLGTGTAPGTYAAVAPGPVPLVSVPDVTRPPARPFTPIAPLAPIGPEFGTDRATAIRERMARRPAPASAPASVAQAAPAAEPDAPRAEAPVPRSPGGLGGLGGLSFGDHISALGMSLMTGGGGNYLGNYPQALENIRQRRREEAQVAQTQQGVRALGRALGLSDDEIAQIGPNIEVMKAIAQQQQQQAMRARAEAMAAGMFGTPAPAGQGAAPQAAGEPPPLGSRYSEAGAPAGTAAPAPDGTPAPSTAAPVRDPYADVRGMSQRIAQLEATAAAYEAAGDPVMAATFKAQAGALERDIEAMAPTSDMREYNAAVAQGYTGSFIDFLYGKAERLGGVPAQSNDFRKKLDQLTAEEIGAIAQTGREAELRLALVDQLDGLLSQSPQGFEGAIKAFAGNLGISTEGLGTIQAAQAVINRMVPAQRPPGSGPMSDADLELFKQSLPRIINEPNGNQIIVQTLRSIARYDMDVGRIARRLTTDTNYTLEEAFADMDRVQNPLAYIRVLGQIPYEAVQMLQNDPSEQNRAFFNEQFGEGAAQRVLGDM